MKRSKYTEETIIGMLKERQAGMKVADLTRKYAVSEQSIYRCQARYGGMTVCEAKRSRQLEEENTRLKRMVAELSLDKQML
jgi:putative transposase